MLRCDACNKGYRAGQPDILILNHTKDYHGLALELKTPNGSGVVSLKQVHYLEDFNKQRFKTIISNDYDEIVIELSNYYNPIKYPCPRCRKQFNSIRTLNSHIRAFHSIDI